MSNESQKAKIAHQSDSSFYFITKERFERGYTAMFYPLWQMCLERIVQLEKERGTAMAEFQAFARENIPPGMDAADLPEELKSTLWDLETKLALLMTELLGLNNMLRYQDPIRQKEGQGLPMPFLLSTKAIGFLPGLHSRIQERLTVLGDYDDYLRDLKEAGESTVADFMASPNTEDSVLGERVEEPSPEPVEEPEEEPASFLGSASFTPLFGTGQPLPEGFMADLTPRNPFVGDPGAEPLYGYGSHPSNFSPGVPPPMDSMPLSSHEDSEQGLAPGIYRASPNGEMTKLSTLWEEELFDTMGTDGNPILVFGLSALELFGSGGPWSRLLLELSENRSKLEPDLWKRLVGYAVFSRILASRVPFEVSHALFRGADLAGILADATAPPVQQEPLRFNPGAYDFSDAPFLGVSDGESILAETAGEWLSNLSPDQFMTSVESAEQLSEAPLGFLLMMENLSMLQGIVQGQLGVSSFQANRSLAELETLVHSGIQGFYELSEIAASASHQHDSAAFVSEENSNTAQIDKLLQGLRSLGSETSSEPHTLRQLLEQSEAHRRDLKEIALAAVSGKDSSDPLGLESLSELLTSVMNSPNLAPLVEVFMKNKKR